MKPSLLVTADRLSPDWSSPQSRVLRFPRQEQTPDETGLSSPIALVSAWALVALIPLFGGRAVALTLDEPLLGLVAGMLALIPVMIALAPRR